MNWYYGIDGHVGRWNSKYIHWANDNDNYTVIGIDGIIAIEYNFKEIPINISADWKPALNLVEHTRFWGDNGAISVRFIF